MAVSSARARMTRPVALGLVTAGTLAVVLPWAWPARAERMENEVAVFAALDKVTARISRLEIGLGKTVRFGSLKVTPRSCFSRPPTEQPKTTAFVEVQEIKLDGSEKGLFSGWMFAESPGLNAVEHPVFDVWLTECTKPAKNVVAGAQSSGSARNAQGGAGASKGAGGANSDEQPAEEVRRPRRVPR